MTTFFNKSKLATTMLLCGSLAMTQALIGCTNKDDKKANKKSDTASQTDGKNTPLDCASPATATGIQQYITKQIAQQANSTVQQLGQQAHINVQNVSMDSILAQLMVNVQSVKTVSGQADQCQGKVAVTIPANDIANANQMATSLNQPTLAQRLSSKGLALENNTIVAETATFKLPTNGGGFQVNSPSADTLISEVSNVMASSQLKQMMIQNAPTANSTATSGTATTLNNNAVATATTGAVVAGAGAVAHHAIKKHTSNQGNDTHHASSKRIVAKHSTERDDDDESEEKVAKKATTTKASEPKTSIHKTTSETANTKTVITKTTTEKTSAPTKVTTTHTTEKTVTKPQAVPNDTTKLTIEQRNEKY